MYNFDITEWSVHDHRWALELLKKCQSTQTSSSYIILSWNSLYQISKPDCWEQSKWMWWTYFNHQREFFFFGVCERDLETEVSIEDQAYILEWPSLINHLIEVMLWRRLQHWNIWGYMAILCQNGYNRMEPSSLNSAFHIIQRRTSVGLLSFKFLISWAGLKWWVAGRARKDERGTQW